MGYAAEYLIESESSLFDKSIVWTAAEYFNLSVNRLQVRNKACSREKIKHLPPTFHPHVTTHIAICVAPSILKGNAPRPECAVSPFVHPQNQHPISRASILRPYMATMFKNIRRLGDMPLIITSQSQLNHFTKSISVPCIICHAHEIRPPFSANAIQAPPPPCMSRHTMAI